MVLAILNAIAAIPSLLGYLQTFAAQVVLWYVQSQNNTTLSAIADAAAFAAKAQTEADRYAAAQKWKDALSRPRISA